MTDARRLPALRLSVVFVAATAVLAGCASDPKASLSKRPKSKEYFAESEYGVKASPRVSNKRTRLPRGGGRDQLGKPYQIKGTWYVPKEQKNYARTGKASWYGDAFHGRLTANGEIYDQTHLTAAHPTMPLPSYARVTNSKNGASVIVRVNDRGPYAHGRIIDLSRRAAEMLDYTHSGVADVKVEYVGRAPLHGQDDAYLLASYRPGRAGPSPSDGLPTGVMIAMAGPTPTAGVPAAAVPPAFPTAPVEAAPVEASPAQAASVQIASAQLAQPAVAPLLPGSVELPDEGPYIFDRPVAGLTAPLAAAGDPALGYAPRSTFAAAAALDGLASGGLDVSAATGETIVVATHDSLDAARAHAARIAALGGVSVEAADADGRTLYAVSLVAKGPTDAALKALWAMGDTDAFAVRD